MSSAFKFSIVFLILVFGITKLYASESLEVITARTEGLATHIVKELIKETGLDVEIQKLPWARAYEKALKEENVLIYALSYSEQRAPLFHWVGPIIEIKQNVYRLKERDNIVASNLEDLKQFRIGVVNGFSSTDFLESKGLGGSLQKVYREDLNILKLRDKRIDVFVMSDVSLKDNLFLAGEIENQSQYVPVLTIYKEQEFLGFSLDTYETYIQLFQNAFNKLKLSGRYEEIFEAHSSGR